ncbi:probable trehalose-phosphate phosphatase 4 isoform X2 [Populus trichocarpa]|uniref:probable trehalose-phosphate phosphatase 4 isoform X2 n=1 Tax=Populus trichocarpa TaxID=3694 RepID=UPI0022780730|nr:probable trehalose-phosphate phosphatase 4 isoform X2 [Populus trichocarpa]
MFKRNFAKLNQAMGFQRSSNRQKVQPGVSDLSSNERAPNSCHPVINGSAVSDDANYSSWMMRAAVREVAKYFPTAIISGRSRDKVKGFVQLNNIYYAGSHGMDIMAPPRPVRSSDGKYHTVSLDRKGNEAVFQPAQKFLPSIQKILKELEEAIMKIQGARVENNRFCVSVHFRQVRDEDYGILEEKVKSILKHYPDFRLGWGKKVMEIRPSIEWDKGNALEYLLDTLGLGNCTDVLPVYIGDDRTDEDAFKVIQKRGQGYPIVVASSPKDTKASYSLHDPSEVLTFLLRLARWRKASSSSRSLSQIWGVGS